MYFLPIKHIQYIVNNLYQRHRERLFADKKLGWYVKNYLRSPEAGISFSVITPYVEYYLWCHKESVDWEDFYLTSMSEDFIRRFQDYVSWDTVHFFSNLSEAFIREFEDRLPRYVSAEAGLFLESIRFLWD